MQRDPRAALRAVNALDAELTLAVGLPAHALAVGCAGPAGQHLDPVGNDEGRIEAHTELADQVGIAALFTGHLAQEVAGTGACDRAQLTGGILARHADTVVLNGNGARFGIEVDTDLQLRIRFQQLRRRNRLKAQPVGGVRSVGDQLAEEDLAIAVQRMHHKVQKLLHLGLKTVGFTRLDCHWLYLRPDVLQGAGTRAAPVNCLYRGSCRNFKVQAAKAALVQRLARLRTT